MTKALTIRVWIVYRINTRDFPSMTSSVHDSSSLCRDDLRTCMQCRQAMAASIVLSEEAEEPFERLCEEFIIHTLTTAASALSRHVIDYEPVDDNVSMSPNIQGKKEFKE